MLTFNDLLALEDVEVASVRLVRHQDSRLKPGRLYEAWRNDRDAFESYQSVQGMDKFRVGGSIAGFVATEAQKTVFVGLYRVESVDRCPPGSTDALLKHDTSGHFRYQLALREELSQYIDRLVIEWGAGTRSWVQLATNQPKAILEIADQFEPRFPGFRDFVRPLEDIPMLPNGWQQVLRSVKGIYLLVDLESGDQYVGSAKGAESLFGRWMEYAINGHGGNLGLRRAASRGARRYQVSVLEVVDENTPDATIEQIESHWKNKLLSRKFGLNAN
ncbi:GIY-YIG nuclease family protein [Phycicoccus sp. DTK01]|uniref:GIY-YIG nuclease family protein n=1 Tax=Phycicoccus sp. DTK01 TaxID=2785745 RepID=UPI001A8F4845|nr:GIY-YIG nuclease family protein [Phycicoccus sp. DTK01]GIL37610.1 hypothetical protein PDTK01_36850 [Phycicoccus sp. DTK01]